MTELEMSQWERPNKKDKHFYLGFLIDVQNLEPIGKAYNWPVP